VKFRSYVFMFFPSNLLRGLFLIYVCKCTDISLFFSFSFLGMSPSFWLYKHSFFMLYQVRFVDPLLRSPIVSEVAYETMVKLARCTALPLCNWALDIATALRLIVTEEDRVLLDLIPLVGDGEANDRPSLGLFERIINGLSVSCKSGPLPVDSFTFVFPVSFSTHHVIPIQFIELLFY